jgi:hypothetical protein
VPLSHETWLAQSIPDVFSTTSRAMLAGHSAATTNGKVLKLPNRRILKALTPSNKRLTTQPPMPQKSRICMIVIHHEKPSCIGGLHQPTIMAIL